MATSRSEPQTQAAPVIIVTGPAGAGRRTALQVFEDLGADTVDNLPLALVPDFLAGLVPGRAAALGLDLRSRGFSPDALMTLIASLRRRLSHPVSLLYLDCRADILARRYSETRRRHPLTPRDSSSLGIAQDLEAVSPLKSQADLVIDSSDMSPHDLRRALQSWLSRQTRDDPAAPLALSVESFSYKRGLPLGADLVFDCRFLRNPHWAPALRPKDGRDPEVAAYVAADPRFETVVTQLLALAETLLPAYLEEGKSHLALAFGCTGGQHRSVFLTELLAKRLATLGWQVSIRHHELDRLGKGAPSLEAGDAT